MHRIAPFAAAFVIASLCDASAQTLTLDKQRATPGETVRLDATSFRGTVDVYFDTAPQHTSKSGNAFSIEVPASALPGKHWVTVVERKSGDAKQVPLTVSTDWREYGFDAHGTRHNGRENVINKHNVSRLSLAWRAGVGGMGAIIAPIVVGDALYVTGDTALRAFDAVSGRALWTAPGFTSQPAGHDGLIYAAGPQNRLYALDAATGAIKWSSISTGRLIDAPPVIDKGVVYVGSEDGHLYAFKAKTGALLWSSSQLPVGIATSVALSDNAVYVMTEDSREFGYDRQSGSDLWCEDFSLGFYIYPGGGLTALNGLVYANSTEQFAEFDAATGAYVTGQHAGVTGASPAIAEGMLFTASGYDMLAYDVTNGHLIWDTLIDWGVDSSPAVANGVVYVGGRSSMLLAFDEKNGRQLWSAATDSNVNGAVTVANGFVYVTTYNGTLYAYALEGGKDAAYHRDTSPPQFSKLHPDLKRS